MPENPWASADNGETRQWTPVTPPATTGPVGPTGQGFAGPAGPTGPQRSGGNTGLIVAVVAAALAVALLAGVIIWLFARGGDDGGATASPSAPQVSGPPTVTRTVTAAPEPDPVQPEPTTGSSSGSSSGSSGSSGPSGSSGSSSGSAGSGSGSGGSLPTGLGYSGWSGYADASCNGSDTWVYAGGNGSTKVTVCRATNRDGSLRGLYYRGHAGGQGLERDVDMSTADIAGGYFEIPANPATIVIDGDEMRVYENGVLKKTHDFDVARVDTSA